jgi:hypothetical protein
LKSCSEELHQHYTPDVFLLVLDIATTELIAGDFECLPAAFPRKIFEFTKKHHAADALNSRVTTITTATLRRAGNMAGFGLYPATNNTLAVDSNNHNSILSSIEGKPFSRVESA